MKRRPSKSRQLFTVGLLLAIAVSSASTRAAADPFLDEVVSFRAGTGAGFGQDQLPGIVFGPPEGAGLVQGGLHVISLGNGGEIVVRFSDGAVCDGPGPDLVIFENAFHAGSPSGPIFVEAGIVAVSADGETFVEFPYDADTYEGLAGRTPVLSTSANGIDPLDPDAAGGDVFDLSTIGVGRIEYIRITDPGAAIPDPGDRVPPGINGGFDLDAAAVLNPCDDLPISPTATATATSTAMMDMTATVAATVTPTPTEPPLRGDVDGDGTVDRRDQDWVIAEIFDGDGDRLKDVGGGAIASSARVDVNRDGVVRASDLR